jgi:hypothetical protein
VALSDEEELGHLASPVTRLPQDVAVNPRAPAALALSRPVGQSSTQKAVVQARIQELRDRTRATADGRPICLRLRNAATSTPIGWFSADITLETSRQLQPRKLAAHFQLLRQYAQVGGRVKPAAGGATFGGIFSIRSR